MAPDLVLPPQRISLNLRSYLSDCWYYGGCASCYSRGDYGQNNAINSSDRQPLVLWPPGIANCLIDNIYTNWRVTEQRSSMFLSIVFFPLAKKTVYDSFLKTHQRCALVALYAVRQHTHALVNSDYLIKNTSHGFGEQVMWSYLIL